MSGMEESNGIHKTYSLKKALTYSVIVAVAFTGGTYWLSLTLVIAGV
jgi:hypothetical protein